MAGLQVLQCPPHKVSPHCPQKFLYLGVTGFKESLPSISQQSVRCLKHLGAW